MTSASSAAGYGGSPSWLRRAEFWLDERGKGAWIALMVLSFVVFWPLGLALLAYMIWSKRMFSKRCGDSREMDRHGWSGRGCGSRGQHRGQHAPMGMTTGNSAFDAYRADTLRRLEDEQHAFEAFLGRLREAKDKQEFDRFMEDRARAAATPEASDTGEAPRA